MRTRLGFIGLAIVLLYLVLTAATFGHDNPVDYTWSGAGTHHPIDFLMPSDPFPLISSNPWRLTYRVTCHGLRSPPGAPPTFGTSDTFNMDLKGRINGPFSFGTTTGVAGGTSLFSDHRTFSFQKGGTWTLSIHARRECRWTVTAATKP